MILPIKSGQSSITLTQVLSDEVNVGYENLVDHRVVSLNGVKPRDICDFLARVEAAAGLVEIELSSGELVVLDCKQAEASRTRILERYRVDHDRSPDLRTADHSHN